MRSTWPRLFEEAPIEDERHEGGAKAAHVELEAALCERIEPSRQNQARQRLDVPLCKAARNFGSPAGMDFDIVIGEGDDAMTACANAGVSGDAQSGARFMHIANLRKLHAHRPRIAVAGIVDDDDFAWSTALSCNAAKAPGQRRASIPGANHNRNVLRGRRRSCCELIKAVDQVLGIECGSQRERGLWPPS